MAFQLDFTEAEIVRNRLTKRQEKQIQDLYLQAAKDLEKEAEGIPDTTSGSLRRMYIKGLQKQINSRLNEIQGSIGKLVKSNMFSVVSSVIDCNSEFLIKVGMPVEGAFSHISRDIVESVVTGKIYKGDWSLSNALWNTTKKSRKDIQSIIAEGIIQNKSAYDIGKELEKYVNPLAKKPWDWGKVYPGVSRVIDYNAQRLARTMVSHAYQQSFVKTTQPNPFVTKYKWISSNSARVCELCASRDGVLFDKNDLPLDHPNGMCTFVAVIPDSMVDIADRIADWAQGSSDPELDKYSRFLSKS